MVTEETHLFKLFSMLLWKLLQCTSLPNKCSAVVCKQLTLQKPLNLWTQFNRNVCIYEIKPFIDGRKVIYNLALVHYQGGFLHTCVLSDPICSLFFFSNPDKMALSWCSCESERANHKLHNMLLQWEKEEETYLCNFKYFLNQFWQLVLVLWNRGKRSVNTITLLA